MSRLFDVRNFEDPNHLKSFKEYIGSLPRKTRASTRNTYIVALVRKGTENNITPESDITFDTVNADDIIEAREIADKLHSKSGYISVCIIKEAKERYTLRHLRERTINQLAELQKSVR